MKRTTLFILTAAALAATAQAQTRIGSVTLSKPGTAPAPRISQPARSSAVTAATSTSTRTDQVSVPSGWYEVTGRISAADMVSLPAGSKVNVTVNDLTSPAQLIRIQFGASRLPTTYQIIFNPSRLNSSHRYAVQATVLDASGRQLYTSDRSALMPATGKSAVVNVSVR